MYVRCPECEEDVLATDPPDTAEIVCPACGAAWMPGPSDPHSAWRVPVGGPAMWARVRAQYDNDKVHKAFVNFCARASSLDYAARRYRRVQERNEDDEWARAGLERIQTLAVMALNPSARGLRWPTVVRWGLVVLTACGIVAAVLYAQGQLSW